MLPITCSLPVIPLGSKRPKVAAMLPNGHTTSVGKEPIDELAELQKSTPQAIKKAFRRFVACVARAALGLKRDEKHEAACIEQLALKLSIARMAADVFGRVRLLKELKSEPVEPAAFAEKPTPAEEPKLLGMGFLEALRHLIGRVPELARSRQEIQEVYERSGFALIRSADLAVTQQVQKMIADSIAQGSALPSFKAAMEKLDSSFTGPYAETVYRTATTRSYVAGRQQQAKQLPNVVGFEFQAVGDGDTRKSHQAADGVRGGVDDPIWRVVTPPLGFNCLLPGNLVWDKPIWISRAWYTGKAVELETRRGARTRLTVNHPVATPQGFVPAGQLSKGSQVFRHLFSFPRSVPSYSAGFVTEHEQQTPVFVEDLFYSLASERVVDACSGVGPLDFHGEVCRFVGQVDIVWADRKLRDEFVRVSFGQFGDVLLGPGPSFSRKGGLGPRILSVDARKDALADGGREIFPPLGSRGARRSYPRPRPQEEIPRRSIRNSVFSPSVFNAATSGVSGENVVSVFEEDARAATFPSTFRFHASPLEPFSQGVGAKAEASRKIGERISGSVALDEIVHVDQFWWSGHVYDLQTDTGIITAGSDECNAIALGNCRCSLRLLTRAEATRRGWLDQNGELPRAVLPPGAGPDPGGAWGGRADSIYRR